MTRNRWRVTTRRGIAAVHWNAGRSSPQVAALHLDSGYLRLTPVGCGWGTSVVLLPSLWAMGKLWQGAPVAARWTSAGERLELAFSAHLAHLEVSGTVRFRAPDAHSVRAHVAVGVESDPALDEALDARPHEAFKAVMLSSMRLNAELWDARRALVGDQIVELGSGGWIGEVAAPATRFGLEGGDSRWKTGAPTTEIVLSPPLSIAGWVTPSENPNDDNVGLWAASDVVLRAWNYEIIASNPGVTDAGAPGQSAPLETG